MTEYHFDDAAADQAVAFFENCLFHTKGQFARKPFILEPWQREKLIRPLFGWKREDGMRRYRKVRLWVPRKNGKTQLSAGVGTYMMICDAEPEAMVYSLAANEDQAMLTYLAGMTMIENSPVLRSHFEPLKSRIFHPGFSSTWQVLTGRVKGKHGLNASCKLGDELHEWSDGELDDAVRKSMAMRMQPLEFDTSTAGVINSFGHREFEYDRKVAEGIIDDPERLVVIYEASADDDWQDPAIWAKANPNLGVSVREEFLRAECRRGVDNPSLENNFKRYHLNMWTEQAVRWLQMHLWKKCFALDWRTMLDQMRGRECCIGVDLSSNQDVAAVTYVFPPSGGDPLTHIACRMFIPADNIEKRVKDSKVPFDLWARDGAVIATEGNTIDQEAIFAQIIEDAAGLRVKRVGIDKWNTGWIGPKLVDHFGEERGPDGKKKPIVVTVQQGYGSMSPGSKELERLVIAGLLDHGDHPVLRWMASNVAIKRGVQGDIVPIKDKSSDKIDGIVAAIIALSCAMAETVAEPVTYHFQREGLLVI
ncbi:MAG: terminase TerL endonuclease subunit [Pseudomonadota bacterium]|nr:terminase TerL endonuclease subunit [Pseudomonadota bacterium]